MEGWPALPVGVVQRRFREFEVAEELMGLDGVRRALIAYWNEALIGLGEQNKLSSYARHHNWNAIARIHGLMRQEGL